MSVAPGAPRAPGLLGAAGERPTRRDLRGVLACTGAQVTVIAGFAALPRSGPGTVLDLEPIGLLEMFAHNGSVFLLWLAGGLTLGLVTVVLAGFSSATSGLAIGAALERSGLETFAHLGHAVFELPALAIALWLSLRPFGWAVRALRATDDRADEPALPGFVRGVAWWLPIAALLLLAAAAWEVSTPFLPHPGP